MFHMLARASLALAVTGLLAGCGAPPVQAPLILDASTMTAAEAGASDPRLSSHFARWAGTPYAYGGAHSSGVDCSGFVQLTYAALYRLGLPRTTAAQRHAGQEIDPRQLRAGDLVFFSVENKDSHVGIYLGNGEFMHASSSRGVVRDRVASPYWGNRFSAAVRVLRES